jgi:probable HAF family extracellular repeat protein
MITRSRDTNYDGCQVAGWYGMSGDGQIRALSRSGWNGDERDWHVSGNYSSASSINDVGQVVGASYTAEGVLHAFITGPDGMGMLDLNSLVDLANGVILTSAAAINNNGQVIAVGVIPEPETYALMLAGLVLVGFIARPAGRQKIPG